MAESSSPKLTFSHSHIIFHHEPDRSTTAYPDILQGLYYFWRTNEFIEKEFSHERQIGFAARDIEKLYPEIVQTDSNGYKAVDYGRLAPVLVEAIKEQQLQIEELKQREASMQQMISDQQQQLSRLTTMVEELLDKKGPQ